MYVNSDFSGGSQIGYSGPIKPGRQEFYRAQRGGPMPQDRPIRGYDYPPGGNGMDDIGFFQDDDNMSGMQDRRRPQLEYDPMTIDPDYYPQRGGGMARGMISDIRQQTQQRMAPTRAPQYRSMPPPQSQQVTAQPKITRYRTVVDEPLGYCSPSQRGQCYQQPAAQQIQPQQSTSTPQQILYYDPQTGAIQNPNQTTSSTAPQYGIQQAAAPAQQPMYLGYQQPAQQAPTIAYQQAAPTAGYQQAQPAGGNQVPMGYQMANTMPQGYMMPQYGMAQQQPIVIPAQVFSRWFFKEEWNEHLSSEWFQKWPVLYLPTTRSFKICDFTVDLL
jgi:hypothetical protein